MAPKGALSNVQKKFNPPPPRSVLADNLIFVEYIFVQIKKYNVCFSPFEPLLVLFDEKAIIVKKKKIIRD